MHTQCLFQWSLLTPYKHGRNPCKIHNNWLAHCVLIVRTRKKKNLRPTEPLMSHHKHTKSTTHLMTCEKTARTTQSHDCPTVFLLAPHENLTSRGDKQPLSSLSRYGAKKRVQVQRMPAWSAKSRRLGFCGHRNRLLEQNLNEGQLYVI